MKRNCSKMKMGKIAKNGFECKLGKVAEMIGNIAKFGKFKISDFYFKNRAFEGTLMKGISILNYQ